MYIDRVLITHKDIQSFLETFGKLWPMKVFVVFKCTYSFYKCACLPPAAVCWENYSTSFIWLLTWRENCITAHQALFKVMIVELVHFCKKKASATDFISCRFNARNNLETLRKQLVEAWSSLRKLAVSEENSLQRKWNTGTPFGILSKRWFKTCIKDRKETARKTHVRLDK